MFTAVGNIGVFAPQLLRPLARWYCMAQQPDYPQLRQLLILGIVWLALLVLLRPFPALALPLLALLPFGLLYGLYRWARQQREPADEAAGSDAFARRVSQRLADCRASEARFREEAEGITTSIRTLRDDLDRSAAAGPAERERAAALIADLEAEFSLRHAKAAFFADCATRLAALLDRHRLQRSLAARRRELDALRRTNFDDEATLEETRYHLEQDTVELDTIVELSRDAVRSSHTGQTNVLRRRLDELRGTLDQDPATP